MRFIHSLLFLLCTSWFLSAQPAEHAPQLIVNIHIEGLNAALLHRFESNYETGGFARFLNYGAECVNVHTNYYNSNIASDLAALHSGSTPSKNGIIAPSYYNAKKGALISCIATHQETGTAQPNVKKYTANQLLASTFEDELSMFYPQQSRTYSVAPNATEALLSGGHNAVGSFWLDNRSGQWNTSSVYGDTLPAWVAAINASKEVDDYMKKAWNLTKNPDSYEGPNHKDAWPISLKAYQKDPFKYGQLKKTPFINDLITSFVQNLVTTENLTQSTRPNVLNIGYDINDYWQQDDGNASRAREDQYLRMDHNLANLITFLGKRQDLNKILFVLTGSGDITPSLHFLQSTHYPAQEVELDQVQALLNSYLMALYGSGNWVESYTNNQIYLNRTLIDSKGLNIDTVTNAVVAICRKFSAINTATPTSQLIKQQNPSPQDQLIINSLYSDYTGDVFITLNPNRIDSKANVVLRNVVMNNKIPVFFLGWNIKKQQINVSIALSQVMPSLSNALKIPQPNASMETDVPELLNLFK